LRLRDLSSLQFSSGEEIAELFWDIGLKKNTARVLVLLLWDLDLTARDMERVCDLRQPEVSIAITDLMKKRWISVVSQITENKGRPIKIYHLARTLEQILDELRSLTEDDYDKKSVEIEKVREMIKESAIVPRITGEIHPYERL
jgi:predicted transcriptional regulator